MTSTTDTALRWEPFNGADPGEVAEYGAWRFSVTRWQRGSYAVTVTNVETGERRFRAGFNAGLVKTLAQGKALCEEQFRQLREADRDAGRSVSYF